MATKVKGGKQSPKGGLTVKPLVLDRWVVKTRTNALGGQKDYMSLTEREVSSALVSPHSGNSVLAMGETNRALLRQFPYVDTLPQQVPPQEPDDLLEIPVKPGDLVVVKCELQFAANHNSYPKLLMLPPELAKLFVMVEFHDPLVEKVQLVQTFFPLLSLNVFLELEGFQDLTEEDHDESIGDTKIWDRNDLGGFRQKDYVRKRSWLNSNKSANTFETDYVQFHTMVWRSNDLLTCIPGVCETRREKHWFLDNWNTNVYKSFRELSGETMIKFPLVGIVGTLLEQRVITHSFTAGGEYIGGTTHRTTFYKILFRDRVPVWVDAPVWKCPDPLSLPIYLPIP